MGWQGPFNFAAEPEGSGSGACAGALWTLGWWVMARASQGSGEHSFLFGVTTANAGAVLTGDSSNPRPPRVGTAGVLGSQVRTSGLREVKEQAQGHAAGKWQSGGFEPRAPDSGLCRGWWSMEGTEWRGAGGGGSASV